VFDRFVSWPFSAVMPTRQGGMSCKERTDLSSVRSHCARWAGVVALTPVV